jgi:hypothetical protein
VDESLECGICSYAYSYRNVLIKHLITYHSKIVVYKCPLCAYTANAR